ncbi:glycosyltransferase family 2 protein [Christensenellaceae bacterium OttesenSCG-928-L17]|nr:glycosyltransferase family 2 protein [Christensenellaceae bacterium OttesenSCG-928-L17]
MPSKKPQITVVVPCYNVEKYLRRCLDSLLAQTLRGIEVIMVEDCSNDGTKKIVEEYEKAHKNFKAIYNVENGGLGHARNIGITATKTKYISFLDSDDWLPENFYQVMLDCILKGKADLSISDVFLRYDDRRLDKRFLPYDRKPDRFGLINTGTSATSSNKLFRTELFNNLKYPEDIVNEDIPVTLAILYTKKTAYTRETYYNYYQRAGSIQNSKITPKRFDAFKSVRLLKDNLNNNIDKKTWQAVLWHQVIVLLFFVIPKERKILARKNLLEEYFHLLKENKINLTGNAGLKNFMKESRANKIYAKRLIRLLDKRRFLACSLWMGPCSAYINSNGNGKKFIKAMLMLVRHPRQFCQIVVRFLRRRYVIKKDVNINDLIPLAKRQSRLKLSRPVSVVVPNYNYERFLVQRVYSILGQTEKIGELIILDDNSSDNSVKLANEIKKKIEKYIPTRIIVNKNNKGTFRQWERGFDEADYDLVWIAEADDYSDKNFLKKTIEPIEKNDDVVISYSNTGYTNGEGLLLGNVKNDIDIQKSGHWNGDYIIKGIDEAKQYSYLNNTISNVSSVVFRKKVGVDYAKLFNGARNYRQVGDWVFYLNYMVLGSVAYTDKVLNYYRMHGENVSSTIEKQLHFDELKEVHKSFASKLKLGETQKKKMLAREESLTKAWGL